jgi:SAM-dependent methyltransferase
MDGTTGTSRVDQARLMRLLQNEADMAFKRRVRLMFEALDLQPTDRVLDVGCGRGFFMKYVTELAPCRLTGVDLELEHLKIALNAVRAKGAGVARSFVDPLPFRNETFDKIIFTEVLEHLPDDRGGLQEVKRVLKSGGLLFLTVPNHNYPFWWDPLNKTLEAIFHKHIQSGAFAGIWENHERLYYADEIKALVTRAGFEIRTFQPILHYCFPFAHNLVYGLGKPLFEKGVLPRSMRAAADRFGGEQAPTSALNPVRLGIGIFNWIDQFNDGLDPDRSFMIHALSLLKP